MRIMHCEKGSSPIGYTSIKILSNKFSFYNILNIFINQTKHD